MHPVGLVGVRSRIKGDDLSIDEADPEVFFDEHVTLFLFSKPTLSSPTTFGGNLPLGEGGLVIDEAGCLCEIDGRPRLQCCFMESRQLGACKLEEASSPVLKSVSISSLCGCAQLTGQSPPCWLR